MKKIGWSEQQEHTGGLLAALSFSAKLVLKYIIWDG